MKLKLKAVTLKKNRIIFQKGEILVNGILGTIVNPQIEIDKKNKDNTQEDLRIELRVVVLFRHLVPISGWELLCLYILYKPSVKKLIPATNMFCRVCGPSWTCLV